MTNTSLYELTNEFKGIVSQIEEMDLDPQAFQDTLDSLQMPIEQKVENIVKYMRSLEALADAKKLEAKRLSDAASADLKKAERLKEYMADNLQKANIKKLQAGVFALSFRKGSEVVEIDEEQLPEWAYIPQDPKPMGKTELKKFLKEGTEIPGVKIIRKPDSLVVK